MQGLTVDQTRRWMRLTNLQNFMHMLFDRKARALSLGMLWLSFAAGMAATAPASAQASLPVVKLSANIHVIRAEVAATEEDRERGLMYRRALAPNDGMLFVFDELAGHCFWMKNTLIPLSIAFIADDGTITDLDEMRAQTQDNHCPTHATRYALEMNRGWFTAHGLKPGMRILGLPAPQ